MSTSPEPIEPAEGDLSTCAVCGHSIAWLEQAWWHLVGWSHLDDDHDGEPIEAGTGD
ncbi:MAG: hypothetical protein V4472_25655 [Pseudomonadota bacterium]